MKTQISPLVKLMTAALITIGSGAISSQAFAATPANTDINNQAIVTFKDGSGNEYESLSNSAQVKVAQIFSATIEGDLNVTGTRGQTVNLAHTVTNTGNGTDTYTLTFGDNLPAADTRGPDDIDATNIIAFEDLNNNGLPDTNETQYVTGDTFTLDAGESLQLIFAVGIPTNAAAGDTVGIQMDVTASEGGTGPVPVTDEGANFDISGPNNGNGTNADLITVTDNAVVTVAKSDIHLIGTGETESSLGINVDSDGGNDLAVNLIKYTVTVSNVGDDAATDVKIFDGIPKGTTLIETGTYAPTQNGLLAVNGDILTTAEADLSDENAVGVDLDDDSTVDTGGEASLGLAGLDLNGNDTVNDPSPLPGVYAIDSSLPSGTTISMVFYVAYSPEVLPGNTKLKNNAYVCAELNNDPAVIVDGECNNTVDPITSGPISPPPTITTSEEIIDGIIDPVGPGTNGAGGGVEGGMPDTSDPNNNTQVVTTAPAGSEYFYYNIVTNKGNVPDIFNITTDPGTFPANTQISHKNATGTAPLPATNPGDAIPDTGVIPAATCLDIPIAPTVIDGITVQCNQALIRVVVTLPIDAATTATPPVDATTTAQSVNDPAVTDTKKEKLNAIEAPSVDVANQPITSLDPATDVDPINVVDGTLDPVDFGHVEIDPLPGSTFTVPIYIANEGGSSDSFTLTAEGSFDTGTTWYTALPDGWNVVFKNGGIDLNANGTIDGTDIAATGAVITQTPQIPPGAVMFVTAEIEVPADSSKALAVSDQPGAVDANGDSDLDYVISIVVESQKSGAKDRKVEGIDVKTNAAIDISPDVQQGQVEPNGSIIYPQTLENVGNTTEPIDLTSPDNQPGFSSIVEIDTDGDDIPDTTLESLCTGRPSPSFTIQVEQSDGSDATIEVNCDATDGSDTVPTLTLEPGETVDLKVTVLAPNSVSEGTVNTTTVTGTANIGLGGTAGLTDQGLLNTTVVLGQIRLKKYADIDTDCNGVADVAKNFQQIHLTKVKPGECVVWKLVAINEGTTDALNTVISDQRTPFTVFADSGTTIEGITPSITNGGLLSCRNTTDIASAVNPADAAYPLKSAAQQVAVGNICQPSSTTGSDVTPLISGEDVTFTINTLVPGDIAVGHFVVQVQ